MEETSGLKERGRKFPILTVKDALRERKSEIKMG